MAASLAIPIPRALVSEPASERRPAGDPAEPELVRRAQAGDHDAFGALVKRHQGRAYGLALRVLRDETQAEDAVQEAFLKAYTALPRFQGRCAFYTWLYRLVMNQCLDLRRRDPARRYAEMREGDSIDSRPAPVPEVDGVRGPAAELMRKQLRSRFGKAMESLRDEARRILLLREVDGLSYAEIAEAEGIPIGTVMSRLFYARRKLRAILEADQAAGA